MGERQGHQCALQNTKFPEQKKKTEKKTKRKINKKETVTITFKQTERLCHTQKQTAHTRKPVSPPLYVNPASVSVAGVVMGSVVSGVELAVVAGGGVAHGGGGGGGGAGEAMEGVGAGTRGAPRRPLGVQHGRTVGR